MTMSESGLALSDEKFETAAAFAVRCDGADRCGWQPCDTVAVEIENGKRRPIPPYTPPFLPVLAEDVLTSPLDPETPSTAKRLLETVLGGLAAGTMYGHELLEGAVPAVQAGPKNTV